MIIVEGTDKSGKSTLISNIIKDLPPERKKLLELSHFGLLPDDWDYCDDYLHFIKPYIILDRFVDSERAYGPVYRKRVNPRLTMKNLRRVYRKCLSVGAFVIYCEPHIDIAMERVNLMGDMLVKKKEHMEKLRIEFNKIFYNSKYPLPFMAIDTSYPLTKKDISAITTSFLMLERESRRLDSLNMRGFINPSAQILVYTDFQDMDILHEFLEQTGLSIKNFMIIRNRNNENKPVNINHLIESTPKIKRIFVVREQSIIDYADAGNKHPAINCVDFYELTKNLKSLNKIFPS